MTPKAGEALYKKIQVLATQNLEMTEKEVDVLGRLVNSDPVVKALAIVLSHATAPGINLYSLDFGKSEDVTEGLRLQGRINGALMVVEGFINLGVIDEETEEDDKS